MKVMQKQHALHIYGKHWAQRENSLGDRTEIQNDLDSQEYWFRYQYLFHSYLPRSILCQILAQFFFFVEFLPFRAYSMEGETNINQIITQK